MANLSEARQAWREATSGFAQRRRTRTAVMGDGRGTASSNISVPGRTGYVYARETPNSVNFFQVLNQGAVQPADGLPVLLGYPLPGEINPEEQVLGINYTGLGTLTPSTVPGIGPHHKQHEFRGGDEVYIEGRLFLPGLVHPTNPETMTVTIESFVYFWNGWNRWELSTSKDLTEYKPSTGNVRNILIALDPESKNIVYRPGFEISTGDVRYLQGSFDIVPAPSGNEIPLGYVSLKSTTATIGNTAANDNVGDARLHAPPPMKQILERLNQLEGYLGSDPNLATCLAANAQVDGATIVMGGTGTPNVLPKWISSNTLGNSLVLDTGTTVGIGNISFTPNSLATVLDTSTAAMRGITSAQFSNDVLSPQLSLYKSRGTVASATQVLNADILGAIGFMGYDGATGLSSTNTNIGGRIRSLSTEIWSSSAHGAMLSFETVANNATSIIQRAGIDSTGFLINNPAATFFYTIAPAAITAAITLNLPLARQTETFAVKPQVVQKEVAAPGGTGSTSGVMMGLNGAITPQVTGRLDLQISGDIFNATAIADGGQVQIRYGTGTAPTNGAALAGSPVGGLVKYIAATVAEKAPFCIGAIASGLAVGTAYWVDCSLAAITGGNASIADVSLTAFEL